MAPPDQHLQPKGAPDPALAGQNLLAALTAYLDAQRPSRESTPATTADHAGVTLTLADKFWVGALFVGLMLLGTIIPESLFSDSRYKEYFEKLLTWVLAGGLLSRWITAPKDLLLLSRRTGFRWLTIGLVAGSVIFAVDMVTVNVRLQPGTTLKTSAGVPLPASFSTRLATVRVLVSDAHGTPERPFTLSLLDQLWARLRPTPDWRLVHAVVFNCPSPQCPTPSTLEARLTDGTFDTGVLRDLVQAGIETREGATAVIALTGSREVNLPAGTYEMHLRISPTCRQKLPPLILQGTKSDYDVIGETCS